MGASPGGCRPFDQKDVHGGSNSSEKDYNPVTKLKKKTRRGGVTIQCGI